MSYVSTSEAIVTAQRILERVNAEAEITALVQGGDRRTQRIDTFDKQNMIRTQLVKHAWQRIGRQVLAIHPEIVEEVKIASSDKIPGDVLRTLPYMNPMVIYPEPPVFKSWAGKSPTGKPEESMRLLGFFTYGTATVRVDEPILHEDDVKPGVRVEQRIYSTNAPEAQRFGMVLVLESMDKAGSVIDVEFDSVTIYFDKELTLAEYVDELLGRFRWSSHLERDTEKLTRIGRKWMRQVLSVVIGSLFYLCSTVLEAEEVPRKSTAKRVPKSVSRKPISLFKIGWTTGAALTRYRQRREAGWKESEQGDIAHQQDPQHRKAHFKMQPFGPGGLQRKLIFVSAYWTHVERLGEGGVNTARAVPRVNGKGSATDATRAALGVK